MPKEAFQELWSLFIHICPGYKMFSNAQGQRKAFFSCFSIFCHYGLIWFPGRRQIQSLWRQMMTLVWVEPAQVSKSAIPDQHRVWVGWIFEGTNQVVDCCFTFLHNEADNWYKYVDPQSVCSCQRIWCTQSSIKCSYIRKPINMSCLTRQGIFDRVF